MMLTEASYVGAVYDWDTDNVLVWERVDEKTRQLRKWAAEHYFYRYEEGGPYTSLEGYPLVREDFDSKDEFDEARRRAPTSLFESDIPAEFKILMNHYVDKPTPVVNFAFLDIEVDYRSKIGFAGPKNPYGIINAVTIYQSWTRTYKQYVVPPTVNGVRWSGTLEDIRAEFTRLMEEKNLEAGIYPETVICKTEAELLQRLVEDIQDADIISGWNSEYYDLPYIVKRLELVWPKLVAKMCFIGCRKPKWSERDHFGAPEPVVAIYGRSHLDYKDLFEKFTFEGRESFALGNILAEECDMGKLHYEGTLEELYHNDFPTFCAYNFRDVSGMVDLEAKFKFIQMVNQMAHENTCLFQNMLGTVRYVETGITNFCHTHFKVKVADKRIMNDGEKVEGAIVLTPNIGLHEFLGSVDLVSLYPTEIRALNISPEMFIGQFVEGEEAWRGIMFNETMEGIAIPDTATFILRDDGGDTVEYTAEEWRNTLIQQKWAITAYGTIFDQSKGEGLVPAVLTFWFGERKRLQGEKKKFAKLAREEQDPAKKVEYEKQEAHFDLLQLTKKIQLNSTYGALLNVSFRFGRKEMGASVTACGRATTTHMMQVIHKELEGTDVKLVKTTEVEKDGKVTNGYTVDSDVIIYGDTDSCYFRTKATNKEDAIKVADDVAAKVNEGWPEFMRKAFNCQPGHDNLMKAGREVVAERGLFQAKKKYVLKVVDMEGVTPSGGYKLKSQGSEIKKSDTPKIIQSFLKDLMSRILSGDGYPEVEAFVNAQRKALLGKNGDIFSMGVAKQANNLDAFHAAWIRAGRPAAGKVSVGDKGPQAVPGQIRAAIHYNELVKEHEEGAKLIRGGDKVRIFYLKGNHHGYKSIGFPAELERFPSWFTDEFQVDRKLTEEKMMDNKLKGIFSAIGWEVPTPQNTLINSILKF
jgi:DNA polymerase elongation subunit (family B)